MELSLMDEKSSSMRPDLRGKEEAVTATRGQDPAAEEISTATNNLSDQQKKEKPEG